MGGLADEDGEADRQTGGRANEFKEVEKRTSKWGQIVGGQADRRTGAGRHANGQTVRRRADVRTCGRGQMEADGFLKGKTPKVTHQVTLPSEIQRGRPQVAV